MSETQDPERLLADALRAQARSAPPETVTDQVPPRYGLLSGTDASSLERERAALEPVPQPTVRHPPPPPPAHRPLAAYWVLLLAVLLGLATGSVIGLITLL